MVGCPALTKTRGAPLSTRELIPTTTTTIEAMSATATILRCVLRPADQSELFMTCLRSVDTLSPGNVGGSASRCGNCLVLRHARATTRMHRQNNNLCSNIHTCIKVYDVFVEHPDASARHLLADCSGGIRSMDAIDGAA